MTEISKSTQITNTDNIEYNYALDMDNECSICSEKLDSLENDDKITLNCKHTFCYDCLLESYRGTKCNFTIPKTYRICPYCRTPAGYLPLKSGAVPIKGIHREFGKKLTKVPVTFIQCVGIIKTGVNKNKQCKCNSKPGTTYCGKHNPK